MPTYNASPFAPPPVLAEAGVATYLFGSWPMDIATTKMLVDHVALTSNVATLTVTVVEGNIPAVGALISVQGTTSTSGLFNVTNIALTGVTISATTGKGTVTFALTHADVGSAANSGIALVPQPEVTEAVADKASVPFVLPVNDARTDSSRTVVCVCEFPTVPTTCTVKLQMALQNKSSEYFDVDTVATVAGTSVTLNFKELTLQTGGFFRFNISGSGGSGTIIGKVFI